MNEERRDKILKDHPNLFSYAPGKIFECNDGWLDIIEDLANKLEPLIVKCKEENKFEDGESGPCCSQVKEKWGKLRFYMYCCTHEMSDLIEEAENLSAITCEGCGEPGILRGSHWLYTACDECKKK